VVAPAAPRAQMTGRSRRETLATLRPALPREGISSLDRALADGRPVVALESTIISHGMPYPKNVETALLVEQTLRDNGAVPATIAILGGRLKAGLSKEEITYLGKAGRKVIIKNLLGCVGPLGSPIL